MAHLTAAVSRAQAAVNRARQCAMGAREACVDGHATMPADERKRAQDLLDRLGTVHKDRCEGYPRPEAAGPMRANEDDDQYKRRVQDAEASRHMADVEFGNAAPTSDDELGELARPDGFSDERAGVPCLLGRMRGILAVAAGFEARAGKARDEQAAGAAARERREHEQALDRRFQPVERECAERWLDTSPRCAELPNLTGAERAACQDRCKTAAGKARSELLERAMRDCLADFSTRGPQATCKAQPPGGASLDAELSTCTRECRKKGPEAQGGGRSRGRRERARVARSRRAHRVHQHVRPLGTRRVRRQTDGVREGPVHLLVPQDLLPAVWIERQRGQLHDVPLRRAALRVGDLVVLDLVEQRPV